MLVEVCANSLTSAQRAMNAGADRIELCSELGVGGITPSFGLLKLVKKSLQIPVHVLVRPRSGHFTYSKDEFKVLLADVEVCLEYGADAIVIGVLSADGAIDVTRMKQIKKICGAKSLVFHRAFDWVPNPQKALKVLEDLGVYAVLTSGQQVSAEKGIPVLQEWQQQSNVQIMAGGGITAANATRFKAANLAAIHLSGTSFEQQLDIRGKISMNSLKHLVESQVSVTQSGAIQSVIKAVK
ncbi:copper homeostasis protein CutC [Flavobacterium sp. ASW18X]|uniref:copper homeostasis protein CutC n=1 Tax=Flavobacterium sp. ASW18X TaxID=2572595 RepID=UPI0010AE8ECE|nr:copper homeostasis protein CutC [Flavobacterium sp. ASW18X]TKD66613.1 copper homeostasis protein CutC [Flavobacterium sp. ASW18X]